LYVLVDFFLFFTTIHLMYRIILLVFINKFNNKKFDVKYHHNIYQQQNFSGWFYLYLLIFWYCYPCRTGSISCIFQPLSKFMEKKHKTFRHFIASSLTRFLWYLEDMFLWRIRLLSWMKSCVCIYVTLYKTSVSIFKLILNLWEGFAIHWMMHAIENYWNRKDHNLFFEKSNFILITVWDNLITIEKQLLAIQTQFQKHCKQLFNSSLG
jgi:hypothetical protein